MKNCSIVCTDWVFMSFVLTLLLSSAHAPALCRLLLKGSLSVVSFFLYVVHSRPNLFYYGALACKALVEMEVKPKKGKEK